MAKTKRVTVTQEHIDRGERSHGLRCPIALAADAWLVSCEDFKVDGEWWPLTRRARKFVRAFDTGRPVKPFTFVARRVG